MPIVRLRAIRRCRFASLWKGNCLWVRNCALLEAKRERKTRNCSEALGFEFLQTCTPNKLTTAQHCSIHTQFGNYFQQLRANSEFRTCSLVEFATSTSATCANCKLVLFLCLYFDLKLTLRCSTCFCWKCLSEFFLFHHIISMLRSLAKFHYATRN